MANADSDREIAEWILSFPGPKEVYIEGSATPVKSIEELPAGQFRVSALVLEVRDQDFGDAEIVKVGAAKHLSRLMINGPEPLTRLTDAGFASFARTPASKSLKDISLYCELPNITDKAIPALNQMSQLIGLLLPGSNITDGGIQSLSLPNLEGLVVCWYECPNITPACVIGLEKRSPKLRQLAIKGTPLGEASLEPLRAFPSLEKLGLPVTGVSSKNLSPVWSLTQLKKLDLQANPTVNDNTIRELLALSNLEKLQIHVTAVTDESCKTLAALPRLSQLFIGGNAITDSGLEAQASIKPLTYL